MLFDQMHFNAAEGSFRQWLGNLACDSLVSVLQKAVESTMEGLVTMSGKRHATELAIGSKPKVSGKNLVRHWCPLSEPGRWPPCKGMSKWDFFRGASFFQKNGSHSLG